MSFLIALKGRSLWSIMQPTTRRRSLSLLSVLPPQPTDLWRLGKLVCWFKNKKATAVFTCQFCAWIYNVDRRPSVVGFLYWCVTVHANRKSGLSCRFFKNGGWKNSCKPHPSCTFGKYDSLMKNFLWGKVIVLELNLDLFLKGSESLGKVPALKPQHRITWHPFGGCFSSKRPWQIHTGRE